MCMEIINDVFMRITVPAISRLSRLTARPCTVTEILGIHVLETL